MNESCFYSNKKVCDITIPVHNFGVVMHKFIASIAWRWSAMFHANSFLLQSVYNGKKLHIVSLSLNRTKCFSVSFIRN